MINWVLLLLMTNISFGDQPLRVVVLDTGLNVDDEKYTEMLCKDYQAIDFTTEGVNDINGHGTQIVETIKDYAKNSPYCLTILKYYTENNSGPENLKNVVKALTWISWIKPTFVNISGGGSDWSDDEFTLIRKASTTKFIVAVGNDEINLDEECNYYPACYRLKNIYRVGALNNSGNKAKYSNFGSIVDFWQIGEHGNMSGTSIATAVQTGKLIYEETHRSCIVNPQPNYCYR